MDLYAKRELVARMLGVGKSRIWFDPTKSDEIVNAITREDLRSLVERGIIKIKPKKGVTHREGRKRGPGSRKGSKTSVVSRKRAWITKVRAMRRVLKDMKTRGLITGDSYKTLYRMVKGGQIRSISHLKEVASTMKK